MPPGALPDPAVAATEAFYRTTGSLLCDTFRLAGPLSSPHDAAIVALAVPAFAALSLEPLQALVETLVVGTLGITALGAVGMGAVLFQFALGLLACFVIGTTPRVAAAAGDRDRDAASRACAEGMQIAAGVGVVLQYLLWACAPGVINFLSSDVEVASLAVLYLRARLWAVVPGLVMMVGIGAARGHRNMQAPLYGSLAYLLALGALDTWLVLGARWGVEGAGAAAAGAQWVGAAAVVGAMSSRGELRPRHLLAPPRPAAALPYLRTFPSLALNSMAALAPMLAGTSLATSLGPGPLAAHTVLRQISTFWLQGFLAFNATAHSMAASALGGRDAPRAGAELLARVAALAVACSLPLAAGLFAVRASLPGVFTGDEAVGAEVLRVLPLLLAAMPLDALGTALEGGILGAADTRWVATRTALASAVSLAALGAAGAGGGGLPAIWCALKVVSVGALALDLSKFLGPAAREARAATALRKRRPG